MISAAGILIVAPGNKVLFLLRGPGGDHPLEWCIPGGKREPEDADLQACAIRETLEECGYAAVNAELSEHTRGVAGQDSPESEAVDFTTFVCHVGEEFTPVLCDEHLGYAWAPLSAPPGPLHPGVSVALRRFSMVDIDIARAMSLGELVSPQRYQSITLFAIRITGTGKSYRSKLDEHVWRDPEIYLNERFLSRCNGLPVVVEHPETSAMTSDEFNRRMVGSIILPYIKDDEVWGIARIMDDRAIALLCEEQVSTSPGVTFDFRSENIEAVGPDGKKILIEGDPSLIDHLALCWAGVWDKGGPPTGVDRGGVAPVLTRVDSASLDHFIHSLTLLSVRASNLSSHSRANRRGID